MQDLGTQERLPGPIGAKRSGEIVGDVADIIAVMPEIRTVGILLSLTYYHLYVCQMMANGRVNTEMDIVLVEFIIAVLDEKGIETAAFSLECIYAVGPALEAKSMTSGLLLRFCVYGWLIAKCVKSMAKGVVHDFEREVADMVTFVRKDAVADLHVVVLRLLEQEDFGIQVAHVANAKLHVGGCLYSSFAVIDDRCFAHSAEETVEALGAVPAGETVQAQRNLEDGEPFIVWPLRDVGLQLIGRDVLSVAFHVCSRQQVFAFGYEARGVASAQTDDEMQQKQ